MGVMNWEPAPLPEELAGLAQRCENCEEPRKRLRAFVHIVGCPPHVRARLQHRGYNIDPADLNLHCETCLDTGWIMSQDLRELLRRAEGLLRRPEVVDEIVQIRDDEEGGAP